MTFPSYPAYKDSGVEWLGDVPEQWTLSRGDAYISSLTKVVSAESLNDKEVFHYSIPVVQASGDGQLEDGSEIDSSKLLVERRQVLISKLNPRKNTVCLARPHDALTVCSGEFVPLQSDIVDHKWLYYLVGSENFRKRLESLVESATRSHQRVNPADILKFQGAFPSAPEQTQIACFLDHEAARIDALIGEQQRLIELLKEKRQAVISHAVTKGLDPTVPMKNSGVEWLGEVPVHWDVGPVKFFYEFLDGKRIPLKAEDRGAMQGEYPYYGASGIIDYIDDFIFEDDLVLVSEDGANLLTRSTPIAFVARGKYWVNNHAHILRPKDSSLIYWAEVIERQDLSLYVTGSAQPKLTAEALGAVKIAVPPTELERVAIEKYILNIDIALGSLLSQAILGVQLLQERRSALISAAVTGKIDVRGWQPPASAPTPELVQEAV